MMLSRATRSLFLLLALTIPAAATTADAGGNSGAPPPVTPTQVTLQKHFPEWYAAATAEFGWRLFLDGKWAALPAVLPPRVIVLVHGLDEPGKLWRSLAPALAAKGYTVCEFRYPNDQAVRPSAAYLLHSLVELRRRGATDIVIVAHSMGGLVSREMLTSPTLGYAAVAKDAQIPRVRRLIMLGTPNHGSPLARVRFAVELRDQWLHLVNGEGHVLSAFADGTGEAAADLTPGSNFLEDLNGRPLPRDVKLTIIAGVASPVTPETLAELARVNRNEPDIAKRSTMEQFRQSLTEVADGVGDGCVSVVSAKLDGVTDFITVPGTHLSMIRNVLAGSNRIPPAVPLVLERIAAEWPEFTTKPFLSTNSTNVTNPSKTP